MDACSADIDDGREVEYALHQFLFMRRRMARLHNVRDPVALDNWTLLFMNAPPPPPCVMAGLRCDVARRRAAAKLLNR